MTEASSAGRPSAPRQSMMGALIFSLQPIILNVISLPATAYIIHRLGSAAFGQWSAANSLVVTTAALFSLGLRGQYVREIARNPDRIAEATAQQFGLRFLLGVGAALMSVGIAVALGYPSIVLGCTIIASVSGILQSLGATGIDLYQATRRLPTVASVMMTQGLTLTVASVLVAWAGWGPIGLAFAYMLGPTVLFGLYFLMIRRYDFPIRVDWDFPGFWRFIKASRYLGAQQFVSTVGRNAEGLASPKLLGMSQYGLFAVGTMLPDRLVVLPDGLATALFPVVAATFGVDRKASAREVSRYLGLTLGVCLPLCLLTTSVATPLALILLPAQADLCAAVILTTIWGVPLMGVDMIMAYSLNAAGQERAQTRILLIGSLTSLVVSITLIAQFGLAGACASYMAKLLISIVLRIPLFLRVFVLRWTVFWIPRLFLATLAMGVGLGLMHPLIRSFLPVASDRGSVVYWARMFGLIGVEVVLSLTLYIAAALLLRVFGEAEVAAIQGWLKRDLPPGLASMLARMKMRSSKSRNPSEIKTDHVDDLVP